MEDHQRAVGDGARTIRGALFILLMLWFLFPVPLRAQHQTEHLSPVNGDSLNPLILAVIQSIQTDSIRETMMHLQGFGSRFKLKDNRKAIALWLAGKLKSYGYANAGLDSFYCHVTRPVDTLLWQYNVTAKLQGIFAPGEEDVIGAHYDTYSNAAPSILAPGADDNASGVAAVLEIGRVMKQCGYQPESSITFALFAAEEMGGQGSEQMARQAREDGRDIRYMLNLDMIANDPDSLETLKVYSFDGVESAGIFAAGIFSMYTGFSVERPADSINNESDSYFFWIYGFPVAFFIENELSPFWHTPYDTVGACNLDYCSEIARGACAVLMEDQELPYPRSFTAHSSTQNIFLSWLPTKNSHVSGLNVYRSSTSGGGFTFLVSVPPVDSSYIDQSVDKGEEFFYYARTVDGSGRESYPSDTARGVRIHFSDSLLVLNSVADNTNTPDEIIRFYERLLDTIPYTWCDVNRQHPLSLHQLGTHRNVWWMANSFNYTPMLHPSRTELGDFFTNGGNMLLTAFLPAKLLDGVTEKNISLPGGSILRSFFMADSSLRIPPSLFCRALPVAPGYDTLNVDPSKILVPGLPGELQNIETYSPLLQGRVIYLFDSHYNSYSPLGALKGKPVGLEYPGNDFRTVLLSFPLYYLDSADARSLLLEVIRNKFSHPLAIPEASLEGEISGLTLFPNPTTGAVTVEFSVQYSEEMEILLFDVSGHCLSALFQGKKDRGTHRVIVPSGTLKAGIYSVVLRTPTQKLIKEFVLLP